MIERETAFDGGRAAIAIWMNQARGFSKRLFDQTRIDGHLAGQRKNIEEIVVRFERLENAASGAERRGTPLSAARPTIRHDSHAEALAAATCFRRARIDELETCFHEPGDVIEDRSL